MYLYIFQGPKNEIYSETIISLRQSSDIFAETLTKKSNKEQCANPSVDERVMEYIEDGYGNSYVRWKNIKHFDESAIYDAIAFQFLCNGESTFLISYKPVSAGIHTLSIRWQNIHIEGSPFRVKVFQPHDAKRKLKLAKESTEERLSLDTLDTCTLSPIDEKIVQILPSASLVDASYNKGCTDTGNRLTAKLRKEYTVTKRRVKRKIVNRNGEDIIIYESPSPTLSRQSSMTDTSTEEDHYRRSMSNSPTIMESLNESTLSPRDKEHYRKTKEKGRKEKTFNCSSSQTSQEDLAETETPHMMSIVAKVGKFSTSNHSRTTRDPASKEITLDVKKARRQKCIHRSVSDSSLSDYLDLFIIANRLRRSSSENHDEINLDEITPTSDVFGDITSKGISDSPLLKIIQSQSFRKSCCYVTNRGTGHIHSSVSSTSSATSTSSAEMTRKKPLCETQSLPTLGSISDEVVSDIKKKKNLRRNAFKSPRLRSLRAQKRLNSDILRMSESGELFLKGRKKCSREQEEQKSSSYSSDADKPAGQSFDQTFQRDLSKEKQDEPNEFSPQSPDQSFDGEKHQGKQRTHSEEIIEYLTRSPTTGSHRTLRRRESMLKWIENQDFDRGINEASPVTSPISDLPPLMDCKIGEIGTKGHNVPSRPQSIEREDTFPDQMVKIVSKRKQSAGKVKVHFDDSKFSTRTISFEETGQRKGGLHRQASVRRNSEEVAITKDFGTTQANFKTISAGSPNEMPPRRFGIVSPTATMDKCTLVCANEILVETKYLSSLYDLYLLRRKNCIKVSPTDAHADLALNYDDTGMNEAERPRSFSTGAIYEHLFDNRRQLARLLGDMSSDDDTDSADTSGEQNMRQSTIDSGIADDPPYRCSFGNFRTFEDGQRNVHQKICRKPYKGRIFLDPKLVMSESLPDSSNADADESSMFTSESQSIDVGTGVSSRPSSRRGCSRKLRKKRTTKHDVSSLSDTEVVGLYSAKLRQMKYRKQLQPRRPYRYKSQNTQNTASTQRPQNDYFRTVSDNSSPNEPTISDNSIACIEPLSNETRHTTKYGLPTGEQRRSLLNNVMEFQNLNAQSDNFIHQDGTAVHSSTDDGSTGSYINTQTLDVKKSLYSTTLHITVRPTPRSSTCSALSIETKYREIRPGCFLSTFNQTISPKVLSVDYVGSDPRTLSSSGSRYLSSTSSCSSVEKNAENRLYGLPLLKPQKVCGLVHSSSSENEPFYRPMQLLSNKSRFHDDHHSGEGGEEVVSGKSDVDSDTEVSDEEESECRADGVGLSEGQVGAKNNFQVMDYFMKLFVIKTMC